MSKALRLGFSPCPNDAFVFHALVHGLVGTDLSFDVVLDDVETLNGLAEQGALDVAKISYHAFGRLADAWWMLPAGGALGRGVGPLLVSRSSDVDLSTATVATPGGRTTANLLLDLYAPEALRRTEMRYERILPAVADGTVDAGLIIHESRFTYADHGLRMLVDLGEWWERETGAPIPLGGIAARRDLPRATIARVAVAVRASVEYAFSHPDASGAYVAEHAQELSPAVRRRHIETYVNEFTLDVGREGRAAVRTLLERAARRGKLHQPRAPLFWGEA